MAGRKPRRSGRRRFGLVLAGGAILLVAIMAAGLVVAAANAPAPDELLRTGESPMYITILQPVTNSPITGPTSVQVEVAAVDAITQIELWADGQIVGALPPEEIARQQYRAEWTWSPASTGVHILVARATDQQGRVGQSQPVQVIAPGAVRGVQLVSHSAVAGETLNSLAAMNGIPVEDILARNPDLDPSQPLVSGQLVYLPLALPEFSFFEPAELAPAGSVPDGLPEGGAPGVFSNVLFWAQRSLLTIQTPPAAPSVEAEVDGCGVTLIIDDAAVNEAGFLVYRYTTNSADFERIAVLESHKDTGQFIYRDESLYGSYAYYVASFNAGGETPGGLAIVEVDDPVCALTDWTGIRLIDGILELTEPVDRAYFYLSLNGGTATRIPQDSQTFILPVSGAYDAAPYLAALEGQRVEGDVPVSLEAWGWQGSTLQYLGEGQGTLRQNSTGASNAWPWTWATLEVTWGSSVDIREGFAGWMKELVITSSRPYNFRWQTGYPTVDSGIWQISTLPFTEAPDLDPVGLVAEGRIEGSGLIFEIDLTPILGALPWEEPEDAAAEMMSTPTWPSSVSQGLAQSLIEMDSGSMLLTPNLDRARMVPHTYYVRVIPMNGSQPIGEPSNIVVLNIEPPSGGMDIEYYSEEEMEEFRYTWPFASIYNVQVVGFRPLVFEDPNRWGCVELIENNAPVGTPFASIAVGTVLCPDIFRGGGGDGFGLDDLNPLNILEGMANLLSGAWDWIAEQYNKLVDLVIDLFYQFNPLFMQCRLALGATMSEEEADEICHKGAEIAVKAGLASLGLPPSLPSSQGVMEEGLDYMVTVAVEELEAYTGVPCVGPCEDAIRAAFEEGLDMLSHTSVQPACTDAEEAHRHGREPMCLPSFWVVKPAYGSVPEPAVLTVEVSRNPGGNPPPDGVDWPVCEVHIQNVVQNYWEGGTFYRGDNIIRVEPGDISAPLFHAPYLIPPPLEVGESITMVVALEQVTAPLPGVDYYEATYRDWLAYYDEGVITFTVNGAAQVPGVPVVVPCVSRESQQNSTSFTLPAYEGP